MLTISRIFVISLLTIAANALPVPTDTVLPAPKPSVNENRGSRPTSSDNWISPTPNTNQVIAPISSLALPHLLDGRPQGLPSFSELDLSPLPDPRSNNQHGNQAHPAVQPQRSPGQSMANVAPPPQNSNSFGRKILTPVLPHRTKLPSRQGESRSNPSLESPKLPGQSVADVAPPLHNPKSAGQQTLAPKPPVDSAASTKRKHDTGTPEGSTKKPKHAHSYTCQGPECNQPTFTKKEDTMYITLVLLV
jgi:hypothetical protein